MFQHLMRRWLAKIFRFVARTVQPRPKPSRPASRPRFVPRLEVLEKRLTPSTYLVTDPGDTAGSASDVTLRYAVTNAQNGDTITFANSLSGDTITLSSTLTISQNVTITGLGAANLAISGNHAHEVFDVASGVTASISNLTIENGKANTGGGIYNSGTLMLSNSTLSGNSATHFGGVGGGIYNSGTLTVSNSTLSGNSAPSFGGGGIYNSGTLTLSNSTLSGNSAAADGGGIDNSGTATLSNSTLSGNHAYAGGGIYNTGMLTLSNSTLSGNSASLGGGIDNHGTLTLSNSTLSGNSAILGGGIVTDGTLTLSNSTLSGNSANGSSGGGGGIDNGGTLTLQNTIVAGNTGTNSPNIGNGGSLSGSNNLTSGNPLLNGLASNGGPTQTMSEQSGSPALAAGGAVTTVGSGGISSSTAMTITVGDAGAIASTAGAYLIRIDSEDMLVTNVNLSNNTLTVVRGYNGTTATTHSAGAGVYFLLDQRGDAYSGTPNIGAYQSSATAPGTPTVTSVSPTSGTMAGGTSVTITGTNLTNATTVNFGSVAGTILSDSGTQIVALTPTESAGTVDITVTTVGWDTSATSAADRYTFVPVVTSSTASLPANASSMTISGYGFDTNSNNDSISFDNGVSGTVSSATLTSLTVSITSGLTALTAGTALDASVTVDGVSSGSKVQVATVIAAIPVPTVTVNTANLPADASSLIISGTGFGSTAANDSVTFSGGVSGTVMAATSTSLTVSLSGLSSLTAGTTLDASVMVEGVTSGSKVQVATVAPAVGSSTASLPANASSMTISGHGFDTNSNNDSISFDNGVSGTVSSATSTSLTISITSGLSSLTAGTALDASVLVDGVSSGSSKMQVATVAPVVSSSTASLPANVSSITISGYGFDSTVANDSISFDNGVSGTVSSATLTSLTVSITSGLSSLTAGTALDASVSVNGVSSGSSKVQVATVAPAVGSSTASLPANASSMTISGYGFDTNSNKDSISFDNGVSGTVSHATLTSLTVSITSGLSSLTAGTALDASVLVDGVSSGSKVQVATVAPVVSSSTASLPANASSITISGHGFDTNSNNDSISFDNGVSGTVSSATLTSLTVSITSGLSSLTAGTALDASVSVNGVSSGSVQVATVSAAIPVPTVTVNTANLAVNASSLIISGTGFGSIAANDSVTFSGGVSGSVTAATSTSLTVSVSGLSSVSAGTALDASVSVEGVSSGSVQVATVSAAIPVPTVTVNTANLPRSASSLIISGTGFGSIAANDSVTFSGGVSGAVTAATSTSLTVSLSGLSSVSAGTILNASVTVEGVSGGSAVQVATVIPGTYLVTDPGDTAGSASDVTLRYAVTNAQNGDAITFANSLSGDTITLSSTLTISQSVTITGLGAANLAISGNHANKVFDVASGVTASIAYLTIENGHAVTGGGIYNHGTLTLSNSTLSGNFATSGGGIYNTGTLMLSNSTLSGNSDLYFGGGIHNTGALTLSNSTLSGNSSSYYGGGMFNSGALTLSNSTLSGNSAFHSGGGIYNNGTLTLNNSTLSGNSASDFGGGIFNSASGTLTLSSSTLSANSASIGGGIVNQDMLTLINTIVAGNTAATDPDINGSFSGSHNLTSGNPLLNGLANNGGPTQTMAVQGVSPAQGGGGAVTTVGSGGISSTATTITVADAGAIASTAGAYLIRIDSENMLVTNVNLSNNTLTVVRGYNGALATTHSAGAGVYLTLDQRGYVYLGTPNIGAYQTFVLPPLQPTVTGVGPSSGPLGRRHRGHHHGRQPGQCHHGGLRQRGRDHPQRLGHANRGPHSGRVGRHRGHHRDHRGLGHLVHLPGGSVHLCNPAGHHLRRHRLCRQRRECVGRHVALCPQPGRERRLHHLRQQPDRHYHHAEQHVDHQPERHDYRSGGRPGD